MSRPSPRVRQGPSAARIFGGAAIIGLIFALCWTAVAAGAVPHWMGLGPLDLDLLLKSPRMAFRMLVVMTGLVGVVIVAVAAAVLLVALSLRDN